MCCSFRFVLLLFSFHQNNRNSCSNYGTVTFKTEMNRVNKCGWNGYGGRERFSSFRLAVKMNYINITHNTLVWKLKVRPKPGHTKLVWFLKCGNNTHWWSCATYTNTIILCKWGWNESFPSIAMFCCQKKTRQLPFTWNALQCSLTICENKWISCTPKKPNKWKWKIRKSSNHKINEYKIQKIKRQFSNILMCMHEIAAEIKDDKMSANACHCIAMTRMNNWIIQ